jgi:hypothetical protein
MDTMSLWTNFFLLSNFLTLITPIRQLLTHQKWEHVSSRGGGGGGGKPVGNTFKKKTNFAPKKLVRELGIPHTTKN